MDGERMTNVPSAIDGMSTQSAVEMATSMPSGVTSVPKTNVANFNTPINTSIITNDVKHGVEKKNLFDTALEKAMATLRDRMNGIKPSSMDGFQGVPLQNTPTLQSRNYTMDQIPTAQNKNAPQSIGGMVAQNAGVTMAKVRGTNTPSYVYGNTQINLPGDIDLNNDAVVKSAIDENNMVIDWMDESVNDEEAFV